MWINSTGAGPVPRREPQKHLQKRDTEVKKNIAGDFDFVRTCQPTVIMCTVDCVHLPGDVLRQLKQSESSGKTVLGPGLKKESGEVRVIKAGILRFKEPNVYWIDCHQKRYVPTRGEQVIGIVVNKGGDIFRVDIGASEHASLSYLAFEGATKRNRPDVKVGDIVYGRLLVANKDMEPEMVCIDSFARSAGMGVIRDGGFLFTSSLSHIRKILSPSCLLLKVLGNSLPYECSIGLNGRIWVKGRSTKETIAISNGISASEYMDNDQIKVMVRQMTDALAGF